MKLFRITYEVACNNLYYIDIDANSREEAEEIFNSGYWDVDREELLDSSCLDPILEDIQEISETQEDN